MVTFYIYLTHLHFFSLRPGGRNGELHGTIMMEDRHLSPEFRTNSKYAKYFDVKNLPEKYRTPKRTAPILSEPYNATVFRLIKDLIVDPRFSPLMADDLSGLPAAMVVVQKYDVLRDEGLLYAKRLKEFGVETVLHDGQGFHVDHMKLTPEFFRSKTGAKANRDICKFIRRMTKKK